MEHKSRVYKGLATIFLLSVIIILLNLLINTGNLNIEWIKNFLESKGHLGPVAYIMLFTIVPLTLFPDAVLVIAAGMVFGFTKGTIYTIIGAICGATLSFYLSRFFGGLFKNKDDNSDSLSITKLSNKGFFTILILRLIPLFPFDLISYSAGFSRVKYKSFILATAIGALPGIMVYINLGDKFLNIGSNSFYIALSLLVLLFLTSIALTKYFKSNNSSINSDELGKI